MTKVTRLTLEQGSGLERRRVHLREISDDAEAPLETVGQDIRAARQRKGEDLSSVSRALKIRKDHLEALEEGNIQALPGRPYAIGFLRSYAEYLGLDQAQCVERFKAEIAGRGEDADATPQLAVQDEGRLPHGSLILLVLLVIAVVYGGYYLSVSANRLLSEPVAPVPDRFSVEAGAQAKSAAATKVLASTPQTSPASSGQAPAVSPTGQGAEPDKTQDSTPAPNSGGGQTAAVSPAQLPANFTAPGSSSVAAAPPAGHTLDAQNADGRIELRVYRPTRILVQGPDNTVYINRTFRAGDVYRVPNLTGLTLTTPDGGAVEIVLDGASMGLAGKRGQTTEGLSLTPQSIEDRHHGGHSG